MDKIVERLGEDALILETVKRNGRIEMIATDDPQDSPSPEESSELAARTPGCSIWRSVADRHTDLFDQQMIAFVTVTVRTSAPLRTSSRSRQRGLHNLEP